MFADIFTLFGRWNRLNRLRYFLFSLMSALLMIGALFAVFFGLALSGVNLSPEAGIPASIIVVNALVFVFAGWTTACLAGKRLHDLDKTAWLALLFLVPVVSFIFGLYLLFAPGTAGENRFGPDVKEV